MASNGSLRQCAVENCIERALPVWRAAALAKMMIEQLETLADMF